MPHPVPQPDELEEIHELNRLFLMLLQKLARRGGECLGLPAPIARDVADAAPAVLDGVATFPRALFVLNLRFIEAPVRLVEERAVSGAAAAMEHFAADADDLAQTRHALTLTVLLTAWNMTRHRVFLARMFLGLSASESRYLRSLPLSELHLLASTPGLLRCAFPEAQALWASLLRNARDGLPPALRLLGLQPQLACDLADRDGVVGSPGGLIA